MKKATLLSVLALAISFLSQAQTPTIDAFTSSYLSESSEEYSEAISALKSVYSAESYSINLRLGWLNYLSGDMILSQTYYSKAITLEPTSAEAYFGYAYPTSAMGNWHDVLNNYLTYLEFNPHNSTMNYRVASIYYYSLQESDNALKYVQASLKTYPFDFDSNYLLATIHLGLGNIKEAHAAISLALQAQPTSQYALEIYNAVN